jgi:hypothetical protein
MREEFNDLWSYKQDDGYIKVITTNGFVKKNGEAVMGRGCALEAAQRLPWLPKSLGEMINYHGNHVLQIRFGAHELAAHQPNLLLTFPVKHNWWEEADLELIEQSCIELLAWADLYLISENGNYVATRDFIVIPRPGCGNGQRDWETEVKPILEKYFDDRFIVVHMEGK